MTNWNAVNDFERAHAFDICARYLPNGKKHGHKWDVGSTNGEEGNSCRVELSGECAGLFYEWHGRTAKGRLRKLVALVNHWTEEQTIEAYQKDFAVSFGPNGNNHPSPPRARNERAKEGRPEAAVRTVEKFLGPFRLSENQLSERSRIALSGDVVGDATLMFEHFFQPMEIVGLVGDFTFDGEKSKANPIDLGGNVKQAATWSVSETWRAVAKKAGLWFRINPLKSAHGSGKNGAITDADIASYRCWLCESDILPRDLQFSFLGKLLLDGVLPVGAVIDSGDKSLHFEVVVNAPTAEAYREIVERLSELLQPFGIDDGNTNPSRLSRFPGALRSIRLSGDSAMQRLLYLDPTPGALDLEKLRTYLAEGPSPEQQRRQELKKMLTPVRVTDLPPDPPPVLVSGLLYQGCKISFSGTPKSYKTWNLLHFFFCLANGLKYLGLQCLRTAVVIFDFELLPYGIRDRLEVIAGEYQLPGDPFANIRIVPVKGRLVDFSDPLVQQLIVEDFKANSTGAFGIDPLYKATIGMDDANSVAQVTKALRPFETLTVDGAVTFAYNQHFAKGDQSKKAAIDRISGSGGFSWDPDALVTFTKLRTDKAFSVEIIQRYFQEIPPFGVRWHFPLFVRDDDLDPEDIAPSPKTGRPQSDAGDKILAALRGAEESGGLTKTLVQKATGLPKTTVHDNLCRMKGKEVIFATGTNRWQLSASEAEKWNQEDETE